MTRNNELIERIMQMARAVQANRDHIGVLSTGERCAVALVLNNPKLLGSGDSMLWAAYRVGAEWLEASWHARRDLGLE